MTETTPPSKKQTPALKEEEPGILDSYGSFPVWMLKILDLIAPLLSKISLPEKKSSKE